MPKRKYKDKTHRLKRKIRRLQDRLGQDSSSYSTSDEEYNEYERYYPEECNTYPQGSDDEIPILAFSDSENSIADTPPKSVVVAPTTTKPLGSATEATAVDLIQKPGPHTHSSGENTSAEPKPGTSIDTPPSLPPEILEVLGDPKGKEDIFGPKIPEEISKRWGRVLIDGMEKEVKQKLSEKYLVPDNFRLAKAPILNPEITPVLSEAARHRDKLLEKSQNQLGLGISELTNLTTEIIKEDLNKIEILKKISDISQIFLDLHYEDTKRRRKLINSSLDKKFANMITEVKRDKYLFEENLGEKIKATKTAERSGFQVRRSDAIASTSRKYPAQGNWRGPPPTYTQRGYRQGRQRGRYPYHQSRRPPPAPERQRQTTRKMTAKTPKT